MTGPLKPLFTLLFFSSTYLIPFTQIVSHLSMSMNIPCSPFPLHLSHFPLLPPSIGSYFLSFLGFCFLHSRDLLHDNFNPFLIIVQLYITQLQKKYSPRPFCHWMSFGSLIPPQQYNLWHTEAMYTAHGNSHNSDNLSLTETIFSIMWLSHEIKVHVS